MHTTIFLKAKNKNWSAMLFLVRGHFFPQASAKSWPYVHIPCILTENLPRHGGFPNLYCHRDAVSSRLQYHLLHICPSLFPLSFIMIMITIQNPSPYIRKTARQVVLSRCYAANFAHIWGGGSIRALRSASVDANRSPPDFVHPYE